jgi:hypothetical protein
MALTSREWPSPSLAFRGTLTEKSNEYQRFLSSWVTREIGGQWLAAFADNWKRRICNCSATDLIE